MKQHVRQDLPDRPGLGDERDQPDVAAARRAQEGKLLPHPRYQLGPGNPGGVVRAGLCMGAAAIAGRVPGLGVPAGRGIPLLADVADREPADSREGHRGVPRDRAGAAVHPDRALTERFPRPWVAGSIAAGGGAFRVRRLPGRAIIWPHAKQLDATVKTVLLQAESLCRDWA